MPVVHVNDTLMDRVVAHHVGVLRLAAGAVEHVSNRLIVRDRDIYALLQDRATLDGIVTPARLDRLLLSIKTVNSKAYAEIHRFLQTELQDLAEYEIEFGTGLLNTVLPFRWTITQPKKAMVKAIVPEEPLSGGLLSEWIEGMAAGHFARTRAAIRLGVQGKENYLQLTKRVRGTKAIGYRDGVAALSRRSAQGLVMTAYSHIANRARAQLFKANGDLFYGMQWSAILDDTTCPECASLDGEVWPVDEVEETPPAHINCRCVLVPVIDTHDDYQFPRPKKLTYAEWLAKQPPEEQEKILGTSRQLMFAKGLPLKKFVDQSGIRYNLSELRNVEAKTLAPRKATPVSRKSRVLKNFGWKPDIPDLRDHLFSSVYTKGVQLPAKITLRDAMPPVFDQGALGSCVANALVSHHMYVHGKDTPLLSRLDLYWSARYLEGMIAEDSGVMIRDGIKALAKFGVCTEDTWPYKISKFKVDPPNNADKEALAYRITSYQRLRSRADYLKCLALGYPFAFGFTVYDNIYDKSVESSGILSMPTKKNAAIGGHAVLCVGYDTNFHDNPVFRRSGLNTSDVPNFMYEVRNSWGANWGDAGNFWMDPLYLENPDLADDFWTIRR